MAHRSANTVQVTHMQHYCRPTETRTQSNPRQSCNSAASCSYTRRVFQTNTRYTTYRRTTSMSNRTPYSINGLSLTWRGRSSVSLTSVTRVQSTRSAISLVGSASRRLQSQYVRSRNCNFNTAEYVQYTKDANLHALSAQTTHQTTQPA